MQRYFDRVGYKAMAKTLWMPLLLLGLALSLVAPGQPVAAQTISASGWLETDQTWTAGNVYYVDNGPVYVPDGITLTIQPGAIVKLQNNIQVQAGGTLNANGTSNSKITFTSYTDDSVGGDTNGDGPSTGAPGDVQAAAIQNSFGTVNVSHASFRYTSYSVTTNCSPSPGATSVTDSNIEATVSMSHCDVGTVSLQRNHFDVTPVNGNAALETNNSDISGIVLSGANTNTFTGTGLSRVIDASGSGLSSGTTWTLSGNDSNAILMGGLYVEGELNLIEGAIVKFLDGGNVIVSSQTGVVNIEGQQGQPIIFTSYADDSVGGDSYGDGPTTATNADTSIFANAGGTVSIDYADIKYVNSAGTSTNGTVLIKNTSVEGHYGFVFNNTEAALEHVDILNSPQANESIQINDGKVDITDVDIANGLMGIRVTNSDVFIRDTHIHDVAIGMDVSGLSKVTYRGSFSNISDRAIKACNWAHPLVCAVDAGYTDWGRAGGPMVSGGTDLICGAVTANPYLYNNSTLPGPELLQSQNCDNSNNPAYYLNENINYFKQRVNTKQIDCDNGFQDACQAIQTAYVCLTSAVNLATSVYPIPIPPVGPSDINNFAADLAGNTSSYMAGIEDNDPDFRNVEFYAKFVNVLHMIIELSDAYNSCAP